MLNYIVGSVVDISEDSIVFCSNNFGFLIQVAHKNDFCIGQNYKIYVLQILREEYLCLYGFLNCEEMKMFKKLLLVSGIGPKTALNILKNVDYQQLIYNISIKNSEFLSNIPGIGCKANSIIYTLYSKMKEFMINIFEYQDVFDALKKLGFKEAKINDAMSKLKIGLPTEDAIKCCLKEMSYE